MAPALPPWRAPWLRGLAALEAGSFDEGLTALDEAVELGSSELEVFASRSDVLAVLRKLNGVFADTSAAQGDDDATGLFARLALLPRPMQALILATKTDHPPLKRQIREAHSIGDALLHSLNRIDRLPAELLTEIGRYIVLSPGKPSSELALPLAAVSKRWRSIFHEDVSLWRQQRIVYSGRDAKKKVQGALQHGPPRVLWIEEGHGKDPAYALPQLLRGKGHKLEEFRMKLSTHFNLHQIWEIILPAAGNRNRTSPLRVLDLTGIMPYQIDPPPVSLRALTTLVLRSATLRSWADWSPLLERLPNLATFSVQGEAIMDFGPPPPGQTQNVTLPNLTSLSVDGLGSYQPVANVTFHLIAPRLSSLSVRNQRTEMMDTYLFPPNKPANTSELHTLHLEAVRFAALPPLGRMPALTSLSLIKVVIPSSDALARLLSVTADAEPVCPLLEDLRLVGLEGGHFTCRSPFLAMARSRSDTPRASRLKALELETTGHFGMSWKAADAFRACVDVFRCTNIERKPKVEPGLEKGKRVYWVIDD